MNDTSPKTAVQILKSQRKNLRSIIIVMIYMMKGI